MRIDGIRIEHIDGTNEIQFFLQEVEPRTISCTKHIHSTIELLYVKEGNYHVSLDDEKFDIFEGDLALFTSNAIHHVTSGDEPRNAYYVMKIPQSLLFSLAPREAAYEYVMRFAMRRSGERYLWRRGELLGSRIKSALDSLVSEFEERRYASELSLTVRMAALLVEILREAPPSSDTASHRSVADIYRVMEHIRKHYAEDIDERELAAGIGMSYSYFSRSWKRVTGISLREYLNRTRVAHAEQLLFKGDLSVSEVAALCGYNSVSYFISVYRRIAGVTPKHALKPTVEQK